MGLFKRAGIRPRDTLQRSYSGRVSALRKLKISFSKFLLFSILNKLFCNNYVTL